MIHNSRGKTKKPIGGGVSHSGNLIFDPFYTSLEKYVLNKRYLENLTNTRAKLENHTELIGCVEYLCDALL